ncbi:MAG: Rieske (2Fe-2S) protein [Propionibacteriaceae bacterium]|nr:Rieske (2Fe-2S) protein [Propionibacteriaceae bacterium]
MTPTRRQIFQATCGCAAAGLAGCSGPRGETSPSAVVSLAVADVPVGGGVVIAAGPYVVTQPREGEFKAFSGVCTHTGCAVSKVPADGIFCACHGSVFAIADGAVVRGPATVPLPPVPFRRDGDRLVLGEG